MSDDEPTLVIMLPDNGRDDNVLIEVDDFGNQIGTVRLYIPEPDQRSAEQEAFAKSLEEPESIDEQEFNS